MLDSLGSCSQSSAGAGPGRLESRGEPAAAEILSQAPCVLEGVAGHFLAHFARDRQEPVDLTGAESVMPADDPWWRTHFPPNGWGCRCWVRQVSKVETDRKRWKVSERPPERYVTVDDPRTGLPMSMPEGIDPSWDISHRRTQRTERLGQALQDKRGRGLR